MNNEFCWRSVAELSQAVWLIQPLLKLIDLISNIWILSWTQNSSVCRALQGEERQSKNNDEKLNKVGLEITYMLLTANMISHWNKLPWRTVKLLSPEEFKSKWWRSLCKLCFLFEIQVPGLLIGEQWGFLQCLGPQKADWILQGFFLIP